MGGRHPRPRPRPTPARPNPATVSTWCAGCDRLVPAGCMTWDALLYRCNECRNEPMPLIDWGTSERIRG